MPPRTSSSSGKPPQKKIKLSTTKLRTTSLTPSSSPPLVKRIDPFKHFSTPPTSSFQSQPDVKAKGKEPLKETNGKGKEKAIELEAETPETVETDNRLWVDMYEPTTEAELAVHVKKYASVRSWLTEAFEGAPRVRIYRRILALTGPAGTAKTTTIRVLAKELDFDIVEWENPQAERISDDNKPQAIFTQFAQFLHDFQNVTSSVFHTYKTQRKRVILLEDLPNVLHSSTQSDFHAALEEFVLSSQVFPVPIVLIISDVGLRGEASDQRLSAGEWEKGGDAGVVDIRSVLSRGLINGPYVTEIGFNPIAATLLRKALQALITHHFSSTASSSTSAKPPPSKEFLDIIVESSNGDIRSAVMAMQFSCTLDMDTKKVSKRTSKTASAKGNTTRAVLEVVTRREQGLVLFHLMGRLLYNKRKGDPPNPSATAKDVAKDKLIDSKLKDLPKLPKHLRGEERRRSRVDVDNLYTETPIDSSLYSLYIHQNYTQFCTEMEECEGVAETLSAVDASGGEAWYQANPHRFHMLTLGTLHALPTPVPRRGQKIYKPDFFDALKREKEALDGVRDVGGWIVDEGVEKGLSWRAGGWTKRDIALELPGVLKALDAQHGSSLSLPPASHRKFSRMQFRWDDVSAAGVHTLGEQDVDDEVGGEDEGDVVDGKSWMGKEETGGGGWLEGDEIEEF